MKKSVSIIMGIYNCAETLPEAIGSILDQTYGDWILIMCDDGSSDDTFSVAEKYSKEYPDKIFLIRNEKNMGLNYTLNHCLEHADSEFIARMDGDDISLPDRLEKEVDFLKNHPEYAIVSCPMIYFDENGEWGRGRSSGEPTPQSVVKSTPFCHAPCLVRKKAYDDVEGYTVDKRFLRAEDYDLWVKMFAKGYRGYNLSECLYKMRDDREAAGRRKYRYRINEARVKIKAVNELRLSKVNYLYALRPLIVGLLPKRLYGFLHKKRIK